MRGKKKRRSVITWSPKNTSTTSTVEIIVDIAYIFHEFYVKVNPILPTNKNTCLTASSHHTSHQARHGTQTRGKENELILEDCMSVVWSDPLFTFYVLQIMFKKTYHGTQFVWVLWSSIDFWLTTHAHTYAQKKENELGQRIDSGAKLVHNSKWVVHLVFFTVFLVYCMLIYIRIFVHKATMFVETLNSMPSTTTKLKKLFGI